MDAASESGEHLLITHRRLTARARLAPQRALVQMRNEQEIVAVARVVRLLCDRYICLPPAEIHRVVSECHAQFDDCKIRTYVPVLVEHAARDRLHAMPRAPMSVRATSPAVAEPAESGRAFADGRAWAVL